MPVKVKLGRNAHSLGFLWPVVRFVRRWSCSCAVLIGALRLRLSTTTSTRASSTSASPHGPLFASVAQIYAAPQEVRPGQHLTAADHRRSDLRRAGYNANPQLGSFQLRGDAILIKPGPQSYHSTDGATITTTDGAGADPSPPKTAPRCRAYKLEPQLITALSEDKNRTKRRLVTYNEIPPHMVQAVTAIEDRRFFEHGGINYVRTAKCAVQDIIVRPQGLRRLHAHPAARARLLPLARQDTSRARSPRS